jgi:hypothetical protein
MGRSISRVRRHLVAGGPAAGIRVVVFWFTGGRN